MKLPNENLSELKQGKPDPYACLDEFAAYFARIGVASHTIKDCVSGVKKWLVFNDMDIESLKPKEKVELPRQYAITKDRASTKDELKQMLLASNLRG